MEVWDSMKMAAETLDVSRQAIIFAAKTGGRCCGRYWRKVKRIFVIRTSGGYAVCHRNGDVYEAMGQNMSWPADSIPKRNVADVTLAMWKNADWKD